MRLFTLLLLLLPLGVRAADAPAPERLDPSIEKAVVEFLQTQQVEPFVSRVLPTMADWEAEAKRLNIHLEGAALIRARLNTTNNYPLISKYCTQLLKSAGERGYLTSNAQWKVIQATPTRLSTIRYADIHTTEHSMPSSNFRVALRRTSPAESPAKSTDEFLIELNFGIKFPTGWRFLGGPSWFKIPEAILPAYIQEEKRIRTVMEGKQTLTTNVDPTLVDLGNKLLTFLQSKQLDIFTNSLLIAPEVLIRDYQSREPGAKTASLDDAQKAFEPHTRKSISSAQQVLTLTDEIGANFSQAAVIEVIGKDYYASPPGGGAPEVHVQSLDITFRLTKDKLPANKAHLEGNYILSSRDPSRLLGQWRLNEIRWAKLPEKAVTSERQKRIEFENYVAEHRALPPGTTAPELTLTSLTNKAETRLSHFKDKLVLLEFWASWCGPCQAPMTKLQTIMNDHPEWKDKLHILTISMDDNLEIAQAHVLKRGWTNSPNYWVGSWFSQNAEAFRVSAVPQCYLIETNGVIIASSLDPEKVPSVVNRHLNSK